MAGRRQKLRDGSVGDGGVGRGPVVVAVDWLERVDGVREDGDLLATGHEFVHVGRLALDLDAGFDVMASEEAVDGGSVELPVEALFLNETKAAGLKEAVRGIELIVGIAG